MVFLNPTILLGLLAASIPVILHFLNLRKIKKIEFSTLAFLKELQKSKIRKIKIKQFLLLLLRVLIIAFLVLSFARPTLESTTIGGITSNAKTTAVIIIDNSFSMSIVDEKGSFLNQAKQIAKNIISSFQSGDDVHILTTAENIENTTSTAQTIDNIEVSYIALPIKKLLATSKEIISKSQNLNKEIYIFSDFQKNIFLEKDSLNTNYGFRNTKFYLFYFEENTVNNLSVSNLKINNQIFELNKSVTVTSEISNFSNKNSVEKLNSLFVNKKRVAQKSISVTSNSAKTIQFKSTISNTGIISYVSKLEDDDINYDNVFYNSIVVPDKNNILLVGKNEQEFLFVKSAIKSNLDKTTNFSFVHSKSIKTINLDNYNVLIVAGGYEGNGFAETIKEYIKIGGSVMLFPSNEYNMKEENKLLSSLNIPIISAYSKSDNNNSINSFDEIDLTHPIFSGVFSKENKEVESPKFYKYLKHTTHGRGKSIISLQDKSSFLSEYRLGKGKILFFNISPNIGWSNFPLKNIFSPIINRSISYIVSNYSTENNFIAGSVLAVDVSKRKSKQIRVIRPDESVEFISINSKTQNYLNYSKTNLIGVYKFYSEDVLLDVYAVNYNELESNLELIPLKNFTKKLEDGSNVITEISSTDDYKAKILTARYGSELWQLFLISALLLALFEMYVARSSKKDLAEL